MKDVLGVKIRALQIRMLMWDAWPQHLFVTFSDGARALKG